MASLALRAIHLLPSPRRSPMNHRMIWVIVGDYGMIDTVSVVANVAVIVIRRGEGTPPYGNIHQYAISAGSVCNNALTNCAALLSPRGPSLALRAIHLVPRSAEVKPPV